MPPNCALEVDDVLKPWVWTPKFDLVHLRWMLGSFTPEEWDGLYKQAYENLIPGGWIEQVEPGLMNLWCVLFFRLMADGSLGTDGR